ncbi:adenine phosphoribosyltransferase [Alphaproteobacteria bacterium]|nr:adenine phosphoribosyltransferase [Alphaproteobacteria bacterium]
MNKILESIRTIPDFPKQGIMFRDVTTLFSNPIAFKETINEICSYWKNKNLTKIIGIEARGFIIGSCVSLELGLPFIPIRKKGKLPHETIEENYELEYGKATIEIHSDALNSNDNVLIIDDLIATGGTALAAISLVKRLKASISGCSFIIDLPVLEGKKKISDLGIEVQTLCEFSGH